FCRGRGKESGSWDSNQTRRKGTAERDHLRLGPAKPRRARSACVRSAGTCDCLWQRLPSRVEARDATATLLPSQTDWIRSDPILPRAGTGEQLREDCLISPPCQPASDEVRRFRDHVPVTHAGISPCLRSMSPPANRWAIPAEAKSLLWLAFQCCAGPQRNHVRRASWCQ